MFRFVSFALVALSICVEAIEIHGHRGCRGMRPENTLAAFEAATEAGVDVLELDLHVTSDGVIVIHHDDAIDGKLIKDLPLSAIKKVDCGSQFNPEFPMQVLAPAQIPTLQELFDLVRDKKVRLNLEIKHNPTRPNATISPKELAHTIVKFVQSQGYSNRIYYSSFSPELLKEIRALDSKARIIFIFGKESLNFAKAFSPQNPIKLIVNIANSFQAEALAPEHVLLDQAAVTVLKKAGLKVIPWTVNEKERAHALVKMGVDGLISDYPQTILH